MLKKELKKLKKKCKEKGREEGREKGREEGREETQEKIIREMIRDDMSVDKIARYADTDINYVLKIQNNMIESGQLQVNERRNTRKR